MTKDRKKAVVEEILDRKREIIRRLSVRRSMRDAVLNAKNAGKCAVIAEVKRRGLNGRQQFRVRNGGYNRSMHVYESAAEIARSMEGGGACAISVLTESAFLGDLSDLREVKAAVRVPVLRKDFIFDEFQVVESYASGADAILLIARILSVDDMKSLALKARSLGMETLVEVDRVSAENIRHIDEIGDIASLLGVNNRDIFTLEVDISTFESLAHSLKDAFPDVPLVAMSGVKSAEDAARMFAAGADAVLVGTAIMESDDIKAKVREIVKCAERG